MVLCSYCQKNIGTQSRFCPHCGQPQPQNQTPNLTAAPNVAQASPPSSSRSWVKILVALFVLGFLFVLLIAGGIFAVVVYQLKQSNANKMAVTALQQSPQAQEKLGNIEDIGWPLGSFSSEAGGSGHATFSMSVKGTRGKGKYYASLVKENGQWYLRSARLQMEDGTSVSIDAKSVAPMPANDLSWRIGQQGWGGEQLIADRDAASSWRRVEWPEHGISFEVPGDWVQKSLNKNEVDFRSPDNKFYFIGHLVYFDQNLGSSSLVDSLVKRAAPKLKRKEILGYTRKDIGSARGFIEIDQRSDGYTSAVWTGYYDTEEYGTASVTFLLGSSTHTDFEVAKPIFGAILDSAKFP